VSAGATSGPAAVVGHRLVQPRQSLITGTGWLALFTAAVAVWVATELRVGGRGWLPWLACALPLAAAGALCLARRRATSLAPAAVFASGAVTGAYAVQILEGRKAVALAACVFLLVCAGLTIVLAAVVTAAALSVLGTVSRRRAATWAAAALVFAAVSIPSPVYFPGGPVQTIFAGNTAGGNAAAVCNLVLLALPLVMAGLASARIATVIAIAWLPAAAAQPLGWYLNLDNVLHLDVWYYLSWLVWLAIAAVALTEARNWRSGDRPS